MLGELLKGNTQKVERILKSGYFNTLPKLIPDTHPKNVTKVAKGRNDAAISIFL